MKRILTIIILAFIGIAYGNASNHAMHPLKQISYVKKQIKAKHEPFFSAYQVLIHDADSVMQQQSHALADFSVPGYYTKPKEHKANSLALQDDAYAAYCLALSYKLSGKKEYGEKACYFLNSWASINKKYSDSDGPLVMSYSGTGLLIAAELMSDSKIWSNEDIDIFKVWIKTVYQKATNSIRERKNNWADWGRFGSLLCASFLNNKDEVAENVRLFKLDLFHKIAADGSMPEETRREGNGIWYTYFSLSPMTGACWLVYNLTGENLFTLKHYDACIKKSLDYLSYYYKHPTEWPWFKNPNVDGLWPYNLLEAMGYIYNDSSYFEYVKDHRPITYRVHHFCWTFPTLMPALLKFK